MVIIEALNMVCVQLEVITVRNEHPDFKSDYYGWMENLKE